MTMGVLSAIISKLWRIVYCPFDRIYQYIRLKLRLHGKVRFTRKARIALNSTFEGSNSIEDGSYFSGKMGFGTYICGNCKIEATIGRFTSIGYGTRTICGTHPYQAPFVTTSPVFYSTRRQAMCTFSHEDVFQEILPPPLIGNDCWIGERVSIVGGITVGDGAVILTGAVVTKDVPPYAVVGGVPANVIKYRYDSDTIGLLLGFRWWDKPIEWLRDNRELFCDMAKLEKVLSHIDNNTLPN